jgi:D-alanine-D-alanine ligase
MSNDFPTNQDLSCFDRPLNVVVLMGGIGEERDISLQSGNCVAQALEDAGLKVAAADITPDDLSILDDEQIDIFFIALHGRFGEDGRLQQILEDRSLVYTGSGPQASRLAFDKWASKLCFDKAGITTPKAIEFDAGAEQAQLEKAVARLGKRFVVKPHRQGSTVGVSIVDDPAAALAAASECSGAFGDCMIEEYISGREITVGIVHDHALPIIEIRSRTGFYDYEAKYLDDGTEFLFDTIDDQRLIAGINEAALNCFNVLGCRGFARVDFIVSDDEGICALEVNTIPGFTGHSLLPRAAARRGLSMPGLCLQIVEAALHRNSRPSVTYRG